ncbi:DNA repair protein REV1 [Caerostris extrusa]|uniref:DNA repair protein REV1 n=1 Tax=Caerostris extrusa TaxID=172846 RepID=A0AAV4MHB6_CAEEX|nr:DNA repair protein REV1 [Caerostris extrusa]
MPKENGESSGGGYMAAKKHKLENQCEIQKEHLKQDAHQIFKNIAIYVNGYTKPSAYELKDLVLSHGGKYHVSYYPSETTHVIASNLPKSKNENLKTQIVVKADWITDSVAAGKLLPHQNYLLYTPEAEPKKTALTSVNNKNLPLINNDDAKFPEKQSTISKDSSHPNTVTRDASISPQTHNAAIKAGHPDFLTEFYNHSGPRHFDCWARFKTVCTASCRKSSVAVTHSKGKKGGPQEGSDINYEFSHYANESKEKVGGIISSNVNNNSKEKEYGSMSEIASCSYEARKAGVKNGMFLGKALKLCPNLKTMSYDFDGYMKVSRQLYDIVANYTLDIQRQYVEY